MAQCAEGRADYMWMVAGVPVAPTPAWLDERDKGRVFSTLRRLRIIGLIEAGE